MQCTNNLKQYLIALHNYHDTRQAFPAGRGGPASSTGNVYLNSAWGATLAVLPYIEQSARFERWLEMQSAHNGQCPPPWNDSPGVFEDFYSKPISAFACPSDSEVLRWPSGVGGLTRTHARGNYVTCRADLIKDNHSISTTESQYTRSVFGVGIYYGMSDILDGTSNTIGLSERVVAPSAGTRMAVESVYTNSSGTIETNPTTGCLAYKVGNTYPTGTINVNAAFLFSGHAWHTGSFTTVLPPNSASCLNGFGTSAQGWGIISAGSRHSNGANATKMDGSVVFISETIDCGNLTWSPGGTATSPHSTAKPYRESNYGVWGALGTRAAGESKAL
jgi:prepilin-type processing-associated H-X9-DG protein